MVLRGHRGPTSARAHIAPNGHRPLHQDRVALEYHLVNPFSFVMVPRQGHG